MSQQQQLRFDGQVAIVTGAGGGLGRQYAIDLARRGAKVVVNDLGGSTRGDGSDHKAADTVVAEIKAFGGEATADYNSVVQGAAVVATAMKAYGRVDILINNAGILRDVSFAKLTEQDWKLMQQVHLDGSFAVTKAAWPIMREQKYGRVIMISSPSGLYGSFGQSHYSAVKMGLVGLANTLAIEGSKLNILVNTVAPLAGTRMTETVFTKELLDAFKPEYVSPLILYLVNKSNTETGGVFETGAGWASRVRYERSAGVFFPLEPAFSIEDVAAKFTTINDFSKGATYPKSTSNDTMPLLLDNIERSKNVASTAAPAAKPSKAASGAAAKSSNSKVNVAQVLAWKAAPHTHTWTERDVSLYALGIGAAADPLDRSELKFVYELSPDFQALPTFGVVIPSQALGSVMQVPGLEFNPMQLLHGEQYMEVRKTIPTSGKLINHSRITGLEDKGSGALMTLQVDSKNEQGESVVFNQYSLFIRGIGGFGGAKGPKPVSNDPPANTPPDVVHREKTLSNQALLYRLSGDYNPLHADPDMAATGGFSVPILHGLCSFGYASRAVLKHFGNNEAKRFKSIRARFVSPVYPGETLVTEMWKVSEGKIVFRTRIAERGIYAISNAVIELHTDAPAASTTTAAKPAAASSSSSSSSSSKPASTGFAAETIFTSLQSQASPELVKKVNAIYRFDITKGSEKASWLLDLKNGSGSVARATDASKADCTIGIKDDDFVKLMTGKLDAQQAFMKGVLKVKGNLMLAMKLQMLQPKKAKL